MYIYLSVFNNVSQDWALGGSVIDLCWRLQNHNRSAGGAAVLNLRHVCSLNKQFFCSYKNNIRYIAQRKNSYNFFFSSYILCESKGRIYFIYFIKQTNVSGTLRIINIFTITGYPIQCINRVQLCLNKSILPSMTSISALALRDCLWSRC